MKATHRRLALLVGGGVAALVAGGLLAWMLVGGRRGERTAAPPASQGGLVIDASGAGVGRIDAAKPLRCFVNGQFVGELTLAECAQRNGVATDALDVGVDRSGALAASPQAGTVLAPPPAQGPGQAIPAKPPAGGQATAAGACWRYADGAWRRLPGDATLSGCVQALFAGRCEHAGGATYGRWMQQTLRLVPGKVEISPDNRAFRTLVEQGAGCSLPAG